MLNCSPLSNYNRHLLVLTKCEVLCILFFDIHDKREMGIIILGLRVKKPRCSEVQPLAWNRKAKTQA